MAKRIVLQCRGLATDPNPLLTGPQGGLRVADDVIIREPGVIQQRPSFGAGTTRSTTRVPVRMHGYDGASVVVSEWDGSSDWAVRSKAASAAFTVPTGGAEPLSYTESFPQFANARSNCYWSSKIGPCKVSSISDSAAVLAGMHEAPSGTFSLATGSAMGANTVRAWRWCFVKRDANGLVVRSVPSPWQSYDNASASTTSMNWLIPLPTYALAGDQIELYATITVASGSTPSDMMYLTARHTITSADVTAGYATVLDDRADADLGAELYTNPTREGLLKANYRPPACGALAWWSECLWFGRCVGPWTTAIEIVDVLGASATVDAGGLQRFASTYAGVSGDDITGLADTTSVVVGQAVTDNGVPGSTGGRIAIGTTVLAKTATTVTLSSTPSGTGAVYFHDVVTVDGQAYYASSASSGTAGSGYPTFLVSAGDGERTARELAAVISEYSTSVYAYAIEDPYAPLKGTIVIRSVALDDAQWAVTTTRDAALSFPVDTSGEILVDRDNRPHSLFYSKPGEPEHVPEINFLTVGSEEYPIVALAPLRGALLVFKTDGIYRVTGSPPDGWRVDLLDPVLRPLRAECVDIIGPAAAVWTQHGVKLVTEGGASSISEQIADRLNDGEERVLSIPATTGAWVATSNRENYILVGVPGGLGSLDADEIYCCAMDSRAWSRWTLTAYCARETRVDGAMYLAKSARSDWEISVARGSGDLSTFTGYDASYSVTWTYDATAVTITLTTADRGDWTPKACDWVSAQFEAIPSPVTRYRRITAVALDGTDYVCTLDSVWGSNASSGTAYEGIESVVEWQAQPAADPFETAVAREIQAAVDWSESAATSPDPYVELGASTDIVATPVMQALTLSRTASETPSRYLRATLGREVARAGHFYPRFESCSMMLDWRLLGVALVLEPVSERTRR